MRYSELIELGNRLFFTSEDVAHLFGIEKTSAQVFCSRQVKKGILVRLKKDFYVLTSRWSHYEVADFFRLANYLQVPSYISCAGALSFHGVSTQVQRDWFESVSLKRTARYAVQGKEFLFFKLKRAFYFGFEKREGIFIALKEKALVDACHLQAFGRYSLDTDALDLERFDRKVLEEAMAPFPARTRNLVRRICRI